MDKYLVALMPKAFNDLEDIYKYIATEIKNANAANKIADLLEESIFSLETMPYRGAERKVRKYANKGYKQLFVKNFSVVYRIDEKNKKVIVVTVRFIPSEF